MLYILAIFCPPLAVLLCGKPGQAGLNFLLWLLFWIPGTIHAWMIVSEHKADKRTATLVKAMHAEGERAERIADKAAKASAAAKDSESNG